MKNKTETVEKTLLQILEGENCAQLLDSLTPEELELFNHLTKELREGGHAGAIDINELWKVDYKRKPPTIEEFIDDDYWLGQTLRPRDDNPGIFPIWREMLKRDFDLDSRMHNVVITGSLGIGKCHGKGTLVMLFDGSWKKVEDIRVGDLLMGDDSTPRKVLSLARGIDEMYEVVPDRPVNSPTFTCNSEHILCLKDSDDVVIEISIKDYLKLQSIKKASGIIQRFKLYRAKINFPAQDVKIDPYWLGLWLGDGSSNAAALTIADCDPEILDYHKLYAHSLGMQTKEAESQRHSKCGMYPVTSLDGKSNLLLQLLKSYGLSGPSGTEKRKFIPKEYYKNSEEVRKNLLAGIIDSDGGKYNNGCYGVAFVNKRLAEDTVELARSLGYQVDFREKVTRIKSRGYVGLAHQITISGANDLPVKLPRKRSGKRCANNRRSTSRTGFSIKPLGIGEYFGFTIDGNHRYVVEGQYVTHNTYIMCAMFLYRIALATLLRNPQNFFGLGKGSHIIYAVLSVSKQVVTETAFGDLQNFMANSPYFLEEIGFDPDCKYTNFRVPMGDNIYLTAGSKGHHIIGRNAMGAAMDEGNWRLEANPDDKAYKLYDEIRTRIANRFQKVAGFLPAICILSSSAKDESSFTEKVINDIERTNDPKTQRVYRSAIYKAKRHLLKLKPRWFKVAYGLRTMDPFILSGWYTEDGKPIEDGVTKFEQAPPGAKTELIPEDYHDNFLRNCRVNLQSLSGIATGGSHRLFPSTVDLERCIELGQKDGLTNPAEIELIPISMEDNKNIWDYLRHNKFLTRRSSMVQAIRHPEALRYAHIDLATQSMAGVAIGHLVGRQLVEGLVNNLGQAFSEYRLVFEYDFILTIVAGRSKPISLEKIQNFFFWLRDICHFKFGLVTADQYQSINSLQMMEARGFKTDLLSLDRKKTVYYSWRSGFEELRVRMYRQHQLMREAENLVDGEDKVDHPPEGSKDTCFSGDTLVRLLNGTVRRLDDLPVGKEFWVYSLSEDGIVPAKATAKHKISQERLLRIELDNGKIVRCTKDHQFIGRDGSVIEAQALCPGDSLMPFILKNLKGRNRIWCPVRHRTDYVYRIVHGFIAGPTPKERKRAFLRKLHEQVRNGEIKIDYHYQKHSKLYDKIIELQNSGCSRKEISNALGVSLDAIYQVVVNARRKGFVMPRASTLRSRSYFQKRQQRFEKVEQLIAEGLTVRKACKEVNISVKTLYNWRSELNHKVVSISEEIETSHTFCLTVPDYGNFALESGIFVRNCDAAAGAYYNAITQAAEATSVMGNNSPSVYGDNSMEKKEDTKPTIYIPLPAQPPRTAAFLA